MSQLGHSRRFDRVPPTSALPPSTDIVRLPRQVRFVPVAPNHQIAPLFDHLVSAGQEGRWHGNAERLGGFEIDNWPVSS
jgi:hypothetical protein